MIHNADALISAVDRLEEATSESTVGRELDWMQQTAEALNSLQGAMSRHISDCENGGGMFGKMDLTRPGLARQVASLRQAHLELPILINMMQHQIFSAAEAFSSVAVQATDLPPPRQLEAAVDFDAIRRCAMDLVLILRNHWEHEADLLQESVTTDLGAGD